MLRLAHPAPAGNATPLPARRRGRSRALSLTSEEARYLRASIRNIVRLHYGTLRKLAAALEVDPGILTRRKLPGAGLAVALWRLTRIPVEALVSGQLVGLPSSRPAGDAS